MLGRSGAVRVGRCDGVKGYRRGGEGPEEGDCSSGRGGRVRVEGCIVMTVENETGRPGRKKLRRVPPAYVLRHPKCCKSA